MKRFSAQLVLTNSGPALKRGVITSDDDGTILSVENNAGKLDESRSVEFYNGIIVPGFVNCHCHLELSHLKDFVQPAKGLGDFIMHVRNSRGNVPEGEVYSAAADSDDMMFRQGIILCADICNSSVTFGIKTKSRIHYLNLLEVFGIDPDKAGKRMDEVVRLSQEAGKMELEWSIVPHSAYAVSLPLFRLLKKKTTHNKVTSIHFMESESESLFLSDQSGPLKTSYEGSGLMPSRVRMAENHATVILNEITSSGNLILIHNTFAGLKTIREVQKRRNTFWCLCPGSNLYIEGKLPPVELLISEGCEMTIGTDSLASNRKLSILEELKTLKEHFPSVPFEELIRWATINGARALGKENIYGTIEPGKKPGLLLLDNLDLINMKLLPETTIKRLL